MIEIKAPSAVLIRPISPETAMTNALGERRLTLLCFSNCNIRDSMLPDEKRWRARGRWSGAAMVQRCGPQGGITDDDDDGHSRS